MQNFEKSLTPAQRARLKIYWHFAVIGGSTALLTLLGLADQFKTIDLKTLVTVVGGQAALAILDATRKYFQATGQVQYAAGAGQVEQIVAEKAPVSPKPTLFGLQVEQAAQAFIAPPAPIVSSNPAVASAETQNTLPDIAVIKSQFAKPTPQG